MNKYKAKQKQNQRITRITENTLVVGADIAKMMHVARAVDFRGIELGILLLMKRYQLQSVDCSLLTHRKL